MMKDLLRFDTVVASIALLMSCVTAGAMVYQTRVLQDQFSASVWPYLNVEWDYNPHYARIRLVNDGVGPAVMRSAQLLLDGKVYDGWNREFFSTLFGKPLKRSEHLELGSSSVDASSAIRAGDLMQLVALKSPELPMLQAIKSHNIELKFCYCSINGKCWTLNASNSGVSTQPVPVAACNTHYGIGAPSNILPPP